MIGASMTNTVHRAVDTAIRQIGQGLLGVACSGGADSMALAHAAIVIAGPSNVVVLTVDHGLQPESAAISERVAAWAKEQGAAAVIEPVTVDADRASVEAAARDARYDALEHLADELGCVAVLIGHTARDQAETILMRILRGTGPAGLAGIPSGRARTRTRTRARSPEPLFIRPLLAIDRADIDAYVAEHTLPVWNDPMNDDATLTRSRMRNEIMPLLRRENPQVDAALLRLSESAREWLDAIDAIAAPLATWPIEVTTLREQPAAIRKRAVSLALEALAIDHDAPHLTAIDELVLAKTAGEVSLALPGGARLVRTYDRIAIASDLPITPLAPPAGPYELRTWKHGDRMRPARLKGRSRKLSDLFVDAKIPRAQRRTARVLVRTTDLAIVWAEHLGLAFEEPESTVPKAVQMGGSF
jgi:tRNA(Ile)-lysidine synthase